MSDHLSKTKISLIAYGNIARGDDGAAPVLLNRIEEIQSQIDCQLHLVEDMQLGPEHAYDLKDVDAVIFLDCDSQCETISFKQLAAQINVHFSSHAQTPETVMSLHGMLTESETPPCYQLGIGGDDFELGQNMSERCHKNLKLAQAHLLSLLETPVSQWNPL
ncbi:hydrogenase maturation protease [Pelagibaculum spongiae]|uniref:Hydrogenase maturation protease n=1 Tax=Pelagibaculum spongiae TaxID=2080658 RepID=A0A2V1GSM5_9GAMM|nr:hydrogenase maturation protease [Pelagibaculum spongiae]PVZ65425.1 hypothetical protein DC094_18255 [Pelagibaculum spongiae]